MKDAPCALPFDLRPCMRRGIVISDLHLLARRSDSVTRFESVPPEFPVSLTRVKARTELRPAELR